MLFFTRSSRFWMIDQQSRRSERLQKRWFILTIHVHVTFNSHFHVKFKILKRIVEPKIFHWVDCGTHSLGSACTGPEMMHGLLKSEQNCNHGPDSWYTVSKGWLWSPLNNIDNHMLSAYSMLNRLRDNPSMDIDARDEYSYQSGRRCSIHTARSNWT